MSIRAELDKAVREARRQKLITAKHAGTVAAARALADKIDHWQQIVEYAKEDYEDHGLARPMVPANDNVSLASFLKYMDQLGLTVAADREADKVSGGKKEPAGESKLKGLQRGVGLRPA